MSTLGGLTGLANFGKDFDIGVESLGNVVLESLRGAESLVSNFGLLFLLLESFMLSPLRLIQQVTSTLSHVLPGPSSYSSESELSSSEDEAERRLDLCFFFCFLEAFLRALVSVSTCSDNCA